MIPTDWSGRGQPTAFKKIDPTEWVVLIYYLRGGVRLYKFDAPHHRKNFVISRRLLCEIVQDCLG